MIRVTPAWTALPWQVRLIGEALLEEWRGGTPEVWPHQDRLQANLGVSARTVRRWLLMAERSGVIRRAYRPCARGGRVYGIAGLLEVMEFTRNPQDRFRPANKVSCQTGQLVGRSRTEESIDKSNRPANARAREDQPSQPASRPSDLHNLEEGETAGENGGRDGRLPWWAEGELWASGMAPLSHVEIDEAGARAVFEVLKRKGLSRQQLIRAGEGCARYVYDRAQSERIRRPDLLAKRWAEELQPGELDPGQRKRSGNGGGTGRHPPSPASAFGPGGQVDLDTGDPPAPNRLPRAGPGLTADEERRREQAARLRRGGPGLGRIEAIIEQTLGRASGDTAFAADVCRQQAQKQKQRERTPEDQVAFGIRPPGMDEAEFLQQRRALLAAQGEAAIGAAVAQPAAIAESSGQGTRGGSPESQ